MNTEALDRFLAEALRCAFGRAEPPIWPPHWPSTPDFHDAVMARIAFHGIAFALLQEPAATAAWPRPVQDALRAEARGQSFWELGHREVASQLIEALAASGIESIFTKGTALAYSVYPDPAMRRRGDSDILIAGGTRKTVVQALRDLGLRQTGDISSLQESWVATCRMGFDHEFDLHWRINSSPVLSDVLEQGALPSRAVPLPRLHARARALAPVDNLLMIAINRASHKTFGYYVGNVRQFDHDRLIWALDVDLTCSAFGEQDWQALIEASAATGTAPVVLSALSFAQEQLGTIVPASIRTALAADPGSAVLMRYFEDLPGLERLRLNLSACPTLLTKLAMIRYTLFPGAQAMRERFPDTPHWPLVALYARRLHSGLRPR